MTGRRAFPRKTPLSCQNFMMSKQNGHSLKKMRSESIIGIIHCKFCEVCFSPKRPIQFHGPKAVLTLCGAILSNGAISTPIKTISAPPNTNLTDYMSMYLQFTASVMKRVCLTSKVQNKNIANDSELFIRQLDALWQTNKENVRSI